MLWIQISWTICLFGAELSYISQNLDYYDYDTKTSDISHRYRLMLSIMLMAHICKRFDEGKKPYTIEELREKTDIPIRIVNDLTFKLVEASMIIEISSDEKGEQSRYIPAENLSNLSVGTLVDRIEAHGKWKIDLPVGELLSADWKRVLELRGNYLKSLKDVKLESLA